MIKFYRFILQVSKIFLPPLISFMKTQQKVTVSVVTVTLMFLKELYLTDTNTVINCCLCSFDSFLRYNHSIPNMVVLVKETKR